MWGPSFYLDNMGAWPLLLFLPLCLFSSFTHSFSCLIPPPFSSIIHVFIIKVFLVTWLHRSKSLHSMTVFTNELATCIIRPHTYYYLFNVPWSASLMVSVTADWWILLTSGNIMQINKNPLQSGIIIFNKRCRILWNRSWQMLQNCLNHLQSHWQMKI